MLKAVLFDLDNTLYAYEPCNVAGQQAAYRYLAKQLGCTVAHIEQAVRSARKALHQDLAGQAASHSRLLYYHRAIEQITGGSLPTVAQRAERIFWKAYFQKMKLRPGVLALLRYLQSNAIKIAVVSDLTTDIQISKIRWLRIEAYIDYLVTSEEAGVEKPNPRMLRLALKKLGVTKREVVLVGDSAERDGGAAKRLGIPYIAL